MRGDVHVRFGGRAGETAGRKAALPLTAAPRMAGLLVERRIEMAVAGTLTLLVITVVYLSSVS